MFEVIAMILIRAYAMLNMLCYAVTSQDITRRGRECSVSPTRG